MERTTTIVDAKQIVGSNFIGPLELELISQKIGIRIPEFYPNIPYNKEFLLSVKDDYILILGISQMQNKHPVTLLSLRNQFGIEPEKREPCFYNQDWYIKEDFFQKTLENKWFLVRKNVLNETRGKNPEELSDSYSFPTAILCAYTFFCTYYAIGEILWEHDFVWCNDVDSNGDRIYVGRYLDPLFLAKNGFSIHRHLKIRHNYGVV